MRATTTVLMVLTLGLAQGGPALAQAPSISDADCQNLRLRLGEHARLSDGVRKAVAAQAATAPAVSTPATPAPPPAATDRASRPPTQGRSRDCPNSMSSRRRARIVP